MRHYCLLLILLLLLAGCQKEPAPESASPPAAQTGEALAQVPRIPVDWSEYFGESQGCALIYHSALPQIDEYNAQGCQTPASPCSTFKIISSLLALEKGIVSDAESQLPYDGTQYPREEWNQPLTLAQAFSSSCIWYFRQIIDEAGPDATQSLLDELGYGNKDISQWEGSGANALPQLNGFWLDSSLSISPAQQVEVLVKIFGEDSKYSAHSRQVLRKIMALESPGLQLYGKTGTGDGHAWFIGFLEGSHGRCYIALHLTGEDATGPRAQEIAESILHEKNSQRR